MADYYPLIAKAVAGLEKNTGEGRRALYERARSALVAQLRNMDTPLIESEITRERLALEEAIRKVEAETARSMRDAPRPGLTPTKAPDRARTDPPSRDPAKPPGGDQVRSSGRKSMFADKPSVTDQGLKGFRDVIAASEGLGEATAQAGKSAREAYAAVPPASHDFDRLEPRVEPEGLRTPVKPPPLARPALEPQDRGLDPRQLPPRAPEPADRDLEPARRGFARRQERQQETVEFDGAPQRSRMGLVLAIIAMLLIIGLGAGAFWKKDMIASWLGVRAPAILAPREPAPSQPKITDRVGAPDPQTATPAQTQTPTDPNAAPVAQRVVLIEEDPSNTQGKPYVGSAIWRTETVSPGPGLPKELAVRADIEVPERRITMTFSLRRNTDQALPASHTIEILFNLPADFAFGGVANVPGILMKQAEATRGSPLAGLAVKVTSGFFLVGLSAVETDLQRNMQLLKERSWFDVPIVYNNGRRAILAIEKGNPGERVFEEVFKAWGQ